MAVPAGGFEPPPPNLPPARAAAALRHNNQHNAIHLPMVDMPHSVRMQDVAFSRIFFRLRAQNLTGLICGAIMLFVSRQSDSVPGVYVSASVERAWVCRLCSHLSRSVSLPAAYSSSAAASSPPRTAPPRPSPSPRKNILSYHISLSSELAMITLVQLRALRQLAVPVGQRVQALHRMLRVPHP
jgi:hypothetical protein